MLAGDRFLPEIHLRQPGFTYSACGPLHKERIQEFKETGDSRHISQKELDKAYFQQILKVYLEEKHLILLKSQNIIKILWIYVWSCFNGSQTFW